MSTHITDERLAEIVGAGVPCVPIDAWEVAHVVQELRSLRLSAKREQQAEIDRLNNVIERMQATMSSQAEQWTRSKAAAKGEAMEEAAKIAEESAIGWRDEDFEGKDFYEFEASACLSVAAATRQKAQEIGK